MNETHCQEYLRQTASIAGFLKYREIEDLVAHLIALRNNSGQLYIVGLGGSAANASHMAADFRKLCQIDAHSLDNMAEVTARANDEGFRTIFDGFLSSMQSRDALFVLSVGGGTLMVSRSLIRAIVKAKEIGAKVFGIVGPNGGYTAEYGDCVIKIPVKDNPTPHTEAFQAVIWHCLVSHPKLQRIATKW